MRLRQPNTLATPVRSSRQWTTALAPRTGGGWDFIAHSYVLGSSDPSEWIVVNLDAGAATATAAASAVYSNSNFQVASANTAFTTNQLRAANGRIFFGQRYGQIGTDLTSERYLNAAYFDPDDRTVHQLPSIQSPASSVRQSAVFSAVFDVDGTTLYMGSQAVIGYQPFVFSIDTTTLAVNVIGIVGELESASPKYAYYLAKDAGNDWLYVAVGQTNWELVAIDVSTGAQTVLATTTTGTQSMQFNEQANGWRVTIKDNGINSFYWVADGAIEAWPGSGAPSGGARTVTPYSGTLTGPPELDHSRGIGQVLWRENGSSGDWTRITYDVSYTSEIDIESMTPLSDGTVLGNAEQYQGFFRYRPSTNTADWFGNWTAGLSQPVLLEVDGTVYMCGYPNTALYSFDPTADWLIGTNPTSLGSYFATSGAKYAYRLAHESGRLYMLGRHERDSLGSGIGYYDIAAGTFAGTSTDLDNYNPRGLVILPELERVVIAGQSLDSTDGVIVSYDYDLTEIDRWTLDGWDDAGELFAIGNGIIVCVSATQQVAYRFDVRSGALGAWKELGDTVGVSARSGNEIVVKVGSAMKSLDATTLSLSESFAAHPGADLMSLGRVMYYSDGPTLYQHSIVSEGRRSKRVRSRERSDAQITYYPLSRWRF